MKHSIGKSFAAGTAQNIFTVPNGYIAVVYMAFITNIRSTNSYDMSWRHAHDLSCYPFAYGKSSRQRYFRQFTNGELVMRVLIT